MIAGSLLVRGSCRTLKVAAPRATASKGTFPNFTRQVAASASPGKSARYSVGCSAYKNLIKATKATPKQSGDSTSLCIEYKAVCGQTASNSGTLRCMNCRSGKTNFAATKPTQTRAAATNMFKKRTQYNNQPSVIPETRPRFSHKPA